MRSTHFLTVPHRFRKWRGTDIWTRLRGSEAPLFCRRCIQFSWPVAHFSGPLVSWVCRQCVEKTNTGSIPLLSNSPGSWLCCRCCWLPSQFLSSSCWLGQKRRSWKPKQYGSVWSIGWLWAPQVETLAPVTAEVTLGRLRLCRCGGCWPQGGGFCPQRSSSRCTKHLNYIINN